MTHTLNYSYIGKGRPKINVFHTERRAVKFQCSTVLGSSCKIFGQKVMGCFLESDLAFHVFTMQYSPYLSVLTRTDFAVPCHWALLEWWWWPWSDEQKLCWVWSAKKTWQEKLKIGGKSVGVEQFSDVLWNALMRMAHLCGWWNLQTIHKRTRRDKENEVMAFGLPQHCFYAEEKSWE